MKRLVIKIDEEKCNGCGLCVPSCAEGALQVIDGKARLVSEVLCDGLGACLGECPQGALTVEEREAPAFDERAVQAHLAKTGRYSPAATHAGAAVRASTPTALASHPHATAAEGGCPGARALTLKPPAAAAGVSAEEQATPSQLRHWPVQLMLLPPRAPYLQEADLLLCADCVPFAYPDFHRDLLRGRVVAVGCPKLDDAEYYAEKLATILRDNDVRSITVAQMEVPCCFGLVHVVREAIARAGKPVPLRDLTVTVEGTLAG